MDDFIYFYGFQYGMMDIGNGLGNKGSVFLFFFGKSSSGYGSVNVFIYCYKDGVCFFKWQFIYVKFVGSVQFNGMGEFIFQ